MIENYTKDLKESVYHGAVVSALAIWLHSAWKNVSKNEPSISRKVRCRGWCKIGGYRNTIRFH